MMTLQLCVVGCGEIRGSEMLGGRDLYARRLGSWRFPPGYKRTCHYFG